MNRRAFIGLSSLLVLAGGAVGVLRAFATSTSPAPTPVAACCDEPCTPGCCDMPCCEDGACCQETGGCCEEGAPCAEESGCDSGGCTESAEKTETAAAPVAQKPCCNGG